MYNMIYKKSHGLYWIIEKSFKNLLIYKIYEMIVSIVKYITDISYISDTLYCKEFYEVLRRYLHLNVKKDWIGRLYGIINPNIDINGNIDFNNTIIEIDGDNTNNNEYVKHWIYKQFKLVDNLFRINKLYDYISVDINHVGPANADNFLVVIDVVSRKEMAYNIKRVIKHATIYFCIACMIIFFMNL